MHDLIRRAEAWLSSPEAMTAADDLISDLLAALKAQQPAPVDADEIDRLTRELAELKADRDSWIEQASQRAQETVEAMQQVEAYRLRCEALHSAPREPREPLTDRQVITGVIDNNCTEQDAIRCDTAFIRGVRFAERAHGIGADAPSKE